MGMKQILVMMAAVVSFSVMADELVFKDRALGEAVARKLKKPAGKFLPPPKFTKAELKDITSLSLTNTKITDLGLKELAKLKNLNRLYLEDTKITDEGLKGLTKLQKLTDLDLEGTNITDEGLKEVAKLQKLEWLSLKVTQITDAELKELANLQSLRQLYLGDKTKDNKESTKKDK